MVGGPDFPSILPVKSDRFVNLAQFARALSFGHFLKDFFFLLLLGTKMTFIIKRDDVTNGRRTVVPSRAVEVSMS